MTSKKEALTMRGFLNLYLSNINLNKQQIKNLYLTL